MTLEFFFPFSRLNLQILSVDELEEVMKNKIERHRVSRSV